MLDWITRLKREQSNPREALEFGIDDDPHSGQRTAAALFWFWGSQGFYNEGRHWYEPLLARRSGPPTPETIKALSFASAMAFVQWDLATGAALTDEARTLAANIDDPLTRSFVAFADGIRALYKGDLTRASNRLETAVAEFSECGERTFEIAALYPLGSACDLSGLTERAVECHERVLSITQRCGESVYRSYSLWAMGIAVWRQGDTDRSVQFFEQSLELTRQVRSPRFAAGCLEALAWIACEQHAPQRAATLLGGLPNRSLNRSAPHRSCIRN